MPSIINATTTNGLSTSADNSGSLQLATNNGTTAVTIDTSQNVGIGTSSPAYKLDVTGVVKGGTLQSSGTATGSFSANSWFVQNEGSSISRNYYCGANTSTYGILEEYSAYSNGTPVRTRYSTSDTQIFYTSTAERMRIDSSGNLLVATTNAQTGAMCLAFDGAAKFGLILDNTSTIGSGQFVARFRQNGAFVGSIQTTSTATFYVTSSDYRLKENVAPMIGALAKVAQLKPVTYKWKLDGSDGQGFIAHELAEVVPECVTGEKDAVETIDDVDADGKVIGTKEIPKYQGIDTSFLVATLTAAIQELNAKVEQQAVRIAELEGV